MLPAAVEWMPERSPETAAAVRAAGLTVEELPLLVAVDPVELLLPAGVRLYVVGADDPQLPRYQWVAATAFAHPGGRLRRGGGTGGHLRRGAGPARRRCASGSPPVAP